MNFYKYRFNGAMAQDKRDAYNEKKVYLVECRDGEHNLRDLINYIAKNGNGGHSFSIVVDTDDKRKEKRFFWDGDGSDHINAVVESKTGEDKELVGILLTALSRVRKMAYVDEYDERPEIEKCKIALENIEDLVRPLLDGADFDDYMEDALREIKFVCSNDDPADQKINDIKYLAEEALK